MFNKKLYLSIYIFIFSLSCNNGKDLNKDKSIVQKNVYTNTKLKGDKKPVRSKSKTKKRQNGDNLNIIKAPDFNLADLDGNVINFSAYEGQVIMLTFWGTWCGPCLSLIHI